MRHVAVAYSSDNNYVKLIAVSISSLYQNNKNLKIDTYIFDCGISSENKERIELISNKFGHSIIWINMNELISREWKQTKIYSIATYARFYVDQLSESLDRVLYIDCDTIVNGNIGELWDYDIEGIILIGKKEPEEFVKTREAELNFCFNNNYVNAGIMMINIKEWRSHDVRKKVEEVLDDKKYKLSFLDQDAINIVCYGFIDSSLPETFNGRYEKDKLNKYAILHYGGGGARANLRDFRRLYKKYLNDTFWCDEKELIHCNKLDRLKYRILLILQGNYILFGEKIYSKIIKMHCIFH